MAKKITIRRAGTFFPALCLVVVVLFFSITLWLRVIGLPDWCLRAIEQEAANHGIPLQIKSLTINPFTGLSAKAKDISVALPSHEKNATLNIYKAIVEFNVYDIIAGNYYPSDIQLHNIKASVPTGDGVVIEAKDLRCLFKFLNRGQLLGLNIKGNIQGVDIVTQGTITLPSMKTEKHSQNKNVAIEQTQQVSTIKLTKYITSNISSTIKQVNDIIEEQHWDDSCTPQLNINFKLKKTDTSLDTNIRANINLPRFQYAGIGIRDFTTTIHYNGENIEIEKFDGVLDEPHLPISLKGSYHIANKHLRTTAQSKTSISLLANTLDKSDTKAIQRLIPFSPEESTYVRLLSDITLTDKYNLKSISVRGNINQLNSFNIGKTRIESAHVSFLFSDTDVNIDRMEIRLEKGRIAAVANTDANTSQADLLLAVESTPVETIQNLATDIFGETAVLPKNITVNGLINLKAQASFGLHSLVPDTSRLTDLIPQLKDAQVNLSLEKITYDDLQLTNPKLSLQANNIKLPEEENSNISADKLTLSTTADLIQYGDDTIINTANIKLEGKKIECDTSNVSKKLNLKHFKASVSSSRNQIGDYLITDLQFNLDDITDFYLGKPHEAILHHCKLAVSAQRFQHKQKEVINNFRLNTQPIDDRNEINVNKISLSGEYNKKEINIDVELDYKDVTNKRLLHFTILPATTLPLAHLKPLLTELDIATQEIEWPEAITFSAAGSFELDQHHFKDVEFIVSIPELIRTPNVVPAFKGKKIPVGITLQGNFTTDTNDHLVYNSNVHIQHNNRSFTGQAKGDLTQGFVNITGENNILANTIDALIDDIYAHYIIRDFRFSDKSQNIIKNINAYVNYGQGVEVKCQCDADLRNIDYLMGAIYDEGQNPPVEKLRTDLGKDPYTRVHQATCGVNVHVRYGKPGEKDKQEVILTNPRLLYDNKPWLKRNNIKSGQDVSHIKGQSIVFDLDRYCIILNDIKGEAYPAYAFGMYYAPLQHFMKDIILQKPAKVHTKRCVFPLSSTCQVPMSGLIGTQVDYGAGFRFIGTTIPLRHFSGFVKITDRDVLLDQLNAQSWGGVLDAIVLIDFSHQHTHIEGEIAARNMNLRSIAASYKTELSPALVNASLRFRSPSLDVNAVQGYGNVIVRNGNLLEMRLFKPIQSLVTDLPKYLFNLQKVADSAQNQPEAQQYSTTSRLFNSVFNGSSSRRSSSNKGKSKRKTDPSLPFVNHFLRYNIQDMTGDYIIKNGYFRTRNMVASGYNLDVNIGLAINLNTLELRGNLWPQISSVPTLLLAPVTFLSDFLIDINIFGKIDDIQWKFALSRIFRSTRQRPGMSTQPQQGNRQYQPNNN